MQSNPGYTWDQNKIAIIILFISSNQGLNSSSYKSVVPNNNHFTINSTGIGSHNNNQTVIISAAAAETTWCYGTKLCVVLIKKSKINLIFTDQYVQSF